MTGATACRACDLASGALPLPGGLIHETPSWRVEHCLGPLGVGTLLVKPKRHVLRVADLDAAEAAELGLVLHRTTRVVAQINPAAEQVYINLWSFNDGAPVHIHFVVQALTAELRTAYGATGPRLQTAMFDHHGNPAEADIERAAEAARAAFVAG
jgi:diadenosine tetraphosphate (Ap4A) HIT family hydrolase